MNGSPIQPTRRPTDRTKWQLDCAAPQEGGETGGRAFNPSRLRTRDSWAARRPLSTGSSSGTRQQQPGCSFHGQNKQQIQTGSFKHNHSLSTTSPPHTHNQQHNKHRRPRRLANKRVHKSLPARSPGAAVPLACIRQTRFNTCLQINTLRPCPARGPATRDLGPTPRRTGDVSAGAQDTCVEIAHRIAPHAWAAGCAMPIG